MRKSVAGVTTDYVYTLGGTVTEVNSAGVWSRTEIYAGGKHLATYAGGASGTTYFNHTDWLGTERVRSDMTGAACETVTSLIFGDGQSVSGGCGDPSTRHFTGKQRDDESGLDDFGARYYSSQLGRFVSADWSAVPVPVPYANLTNPQTLNLYALVQENPSTFADLDGHLAPGQLGVPGGMAVQPRMRGGNGNAYGCLDTGCQTEVMILEWALKLTFSDGTTSTQYFNSESDANASYAQIVNGSTGDNSYSQSGLNNAKNALVQFSQMKLGDTCSALIDQIGAAAPRPFSAADLQAQAAASASFVYDGASSPTPLSSVGVNGSGTVGNLFQGTEGVAGVNAFSQSNGNAVWVRSALFASSTSTPNAYLGSNGKPTGFAMAEMVHEMMHKFGYIHPILKTPWDQDMQMRLARLDLLLSVSQSKPHAFNYGEIFNDTWNRNGTLHERLFSGIAGISTRASVHASTVANRLACNRHASCDGFLWQLS